MSNVPEIPISPSLNTQLANAVAAVARAQDHHAHMRSMTAKARNDESDALNKVNEAQHHFDALVAQVKKTAPKESDWQRPVGIPV